MRPLKFAIIGCGAVTERLYVPAINRLKKTRELRIIAVIDKDTGQAKKIASNFDKETIYSSNYEELFDKKIDAAIIALPNYLHAKVATEFLERRINVFLEKPMGISVSECDNLIKASERSGAILAVNYFRRRYLALQIIKESIKNNLFGKLINFNVEEGGKYSWPLKSSWLFDKNISKGGVLLHNGCHTIDLLIWLLGGIELIEYHDNNFYEKGIETDCDIVVKTKDGANGHIRMSFTCNLANKYFFQFERGWICWHYDDIQGFEFSFSGSSLVQKVTVTSPDPIICFSSKGQHSNKSLLECFAEQIENFFDSIAKKSVPYVTGEEARRSIDFIEHCYNNRMPIKKIWSFPTKIENSKITQKEGIVILGASGFIGSSLVERLAESGFTNVRPVVRKYSGGVTISHTGYQIYLADVQDKKSLKDVFRGCATIYYCVVGNEETIVSGIKNCIEAAIASNVKRIIYLSTARVFGYDYTNITDDSRPTPPQWDRYALAKAKAEKIIEKARRNYPIDIRVLRPDIVWGPYSSYWTIDIIWKLLSNNMVLLKTNQTICNLTYIDNLIDIMFLVDQHPNAVNRNFNVSDFQITWREFIEAYCKILEIPIERIKLVSWEEANKMLKKNYSALAKKIFSEIIKIKEVKEIISTMPFYNYIIKYKEKITNVLYKENGAEKSLEIDKAFLYLQNCKTPLPCNNLKEILGYQPRIDFQTAMNLTREWLKFNGFIKKVQK